MNLIKKIKNIIPLSLYSKILKLLIFAIIGIFFELLGIGLVLPIITLVTTGNFDINLGLGTNEILSSFFSKLDDSEVIIIPLLILLMVYTIKGIYIFFLRFYTGKFSYQFVTKLSNDIYKNYLYQDQLFHLKRNSSDLIRVITGEILVFKNVVNPSITIFIEVLILVGILFLLLYFDTNSTLYVFAIILLLSVIYYLIVSRKLKRWGQERVFHDGRKIQNLTQGLHGIKTVKIFNQEDVFLSRFNKNLSVSAKANQYATLVSQIPPILIELIAVFLLSLL